MTKTAVLYARVSGEEQVRKGYSLDAQLDETRAFAEGEGYKILDEIRDPAYERDTLNRPGLNRVRDIVATGDVDIVLAWQRDRFGAYPFPQLLEYEFAEFDTRLRALTHGYAR